MKSSSKDINWYNNFYKNIQLKCPPWYFFMYSELKKCLKRDIQLLEVGCGQALLLEYLVRNQLILEENVFAIDQSNVGVNYAKLKLPNAVIEQGDIYNIKFNKNSFDIVLMAEVIEHLEDSMQALYEIHNVLKKGGKLFISFPNYFSIPWFVLRILAERLNKPDWMSLQPIDKIYSTFDIIRFCRLKGFKYCKCIGTNYFPPILYKIEHPKITQILNFIHFNKLSFHPILIFEKK